MKLMTRWIELAWIVCAVLAAFATAVPAQGKDVPAASARAIRTVIEAQLEAFANDDAVKAFARATATTSSNPRRANGMISAS